MRTNTVLEQLGRREATIGAWVTIPEPLATLQLAGCGFDWLMVDLEHSPIDWGDLAVMNQMIARGGSCPFARLSASTAENAKRALDCGSWGLIFPMVNTREEAEQAVAWSLYPPRGVRGFGPPLPAMEFDTDAQTYYETVHEHTLIGVQIEHIDAVEALDEILGVEGLDVAFVGPGDLAASMGLTPYAAVEDPRLSEAIEHVLQLTLARGVTPGIYTGSPQVAQQRLAQGFRFVAAACDSYYLTAGARAALQSLR